MPATISSNEIIYPTKEYILKAHEEALTFGGAEGVMDEGKIDFLCTYLRDRRLRGTRKEIVLKKAAFILHYIVTQHPFIDGNKRTGFTVAMQFMNLNGFSVRFTEDEMEKLLLDLANLQLDGVEIEEWIKERMYQATP